MQPQAPSSARFSCDPSLSLEAITPGLSASVSAIPSITIFVSTWNLAGMLPPIQQFQSLLAGASSHDLVLVISQEAVQSIERSFLEAGKEKLERELDIILTSHRRIASYTLLALHMVLYIRPRLIRHFSCLQAAHVAVGPANMGTKGAVAFSFCVRGQPFLFLGGHLPSGESIEDAAARVISFRRIICGMADRLTPCEHQTALWDVVLGQLSQLGPPLDAMMREQLQEPSATFLGRFNAVFFGGDFNARLSMPREQALSLIAQPQMLPGVLIHDEFVNARIRIIQGNSVAQNMAASKPNLVMAEDMRLDFRPWFNAAQWQEAPIHWKPTYKFDKWSRIAKKSRYEAGSRRSSQSQSESIGPLPRIRSYSESEAPIDEFICQYDTSSKQRVPGWTDRILWVSPQDILQQALNWCDANKEGTDRSRCPASGCETPREAAKNSTMTCPRHRGCCSSNAFCDEDAIIEVPPAVSETQTDSSASSCDELADVNIVFQEQPHRAQPDTVSIHLPDKPVSPLMRESFTEPLAPPLPGQVQQDEHSPLPSLSHSLSCDDQLYGECAFIDVVDSARDVSPAPPPPAFTEKTPIVVPYHSWTAELATMCSGSLPPYPDSSSESPQPPPLIQRSTDFCHASSPLVRTQTVMDPDLDMETIITSQENVDSDPQVKHLVRCVLYSSVLISRCDSDHRPVVGSFVVSAPRDSEDSLLILPNYSCTSSAQCTTPRYHVLQQKHHTCSIV